MRAHPFPITNAVHPNARLGYGRATPFRRSRLRAYLGWLAPAVCIYTLTAPTAALAQSGLVDPTIPPAALRPLPEKSDSLRSGVSEEPAAEAFDNLRLQGIMMRGQESLAIIDGVTLQLGSRYKGWRIAKISQDGVLLQSAQGSRLLKMNSFVRKTPGSQ